MPIGIERDLAHRPSHERPAVERDVGVEPDHRIDGPRAEEHVLMRLALSPEHERIRFGLAGGQREPRTQRQRPTGHVVGKHQTDAPSEDQITDAGNGLVAVVDALESRQLAPLPILEGGDDDRGANRQQQLEREAPMHASLRVHVPLEQPDVERVLCRLVCERHAGLSLVWHDRMGRVHIRAQHGEPHPEAALVHRSLIR